ncbi:hypothetical protein SS50377_26992 [Spironucleus salmonicida]|uniref:Uncharacterized protein n=1 Tax=Spironucleus salmonicida TaxID=348837 RepID=V6LTC1_9EUKA|nr:hypothetical protein SS50377_26992 [Spironucleus salmonicida]|eukprot:EST47503.1 Hypothetical protein SS50377_12488 [Spironucleus salmonicida]
MLLICGAKTQKEDNKEFALSNSNLDIEHKIRLSIYFSSLNNYAKRRDCKNINVVIRQLYEFLDQKIYSTQNLDEIQCQLKYLQEHVGQLIGQTQNQLTVEMPSLEQVDKLEVLFKTEMAHYKSTLDSYRSQIEILMEQKIQIKTEQCGSRESQQEKIEQLSIISNQLQQLKEECFGLKESINSQFPDDFEQKFQKYSSKFDDICQQKKKDIVQDLSYIREQLSKAIQFNKCNIEELSSAFFIYQQQNITQAQQYQNQIKTLETQIVRLTSQKEVQSQTIIKLLNRTSDLEDKNKNNIQHIESIRDEIHILSQDLATLIVTSRNQKDEFIKILNTFQ